MRPMCRVGSFCLNDCSPRSTRLLRPQYCNRASPCRVSNHPHAPDMVPAVAADRDSIRLRSYVFTDHAFRQPTARLAAPWGMSSSNPRLIAPMLLRQ